MSFAAASDDVVAVYDVDGNPVTDQYCSYFLVPTDKSQEDWMQGIFMTTLAGGGDSDDNPNPAVVQSAGATLSYGFPVIFKYVFTNFASDKKQVTTNTPLLVQVLYSYPWYVQSQEIEKDKKLVNFVMVSLENNKFQTFVLKNVTNDRNSSNEQYTYTLALDINGDHDDELKIVNHNGLRRLAGGGEGEALRFRLFKFRCEERNPSIVTPNQLIKKMQQLNKSEQPQRVNGLTAAQKLELDFLFTAVDGVGSATADPVLDTDGEPLKNGGTYAVVPKGLTLVGVHLCTLDVVEAPSFIDPPVNFPLKLESSAFIPHITTSLPLNISFAQLAPPPCTKSNAWLVVESFPVGWPVKIGTRENHPEGSIVNGVFSIHKHHDDVVVAGGEVEKERYYKFVFCANIGNQYRCGNVGVYTDSSDPIEVRRLAVTKHKPLLTLQFKKPSSFTDHVPALGNPSTTVHFGAAQSSTGAAPSSSNHKLNGRPSVIRGTKLGPSILTWSPWESSLGSWTTETGQVSSPVWASPSPPPLPL
ncbi:Kunitz trypsin inhibitor [Senna tora]|uniref:Kunitz trypsin inhibitor n=1 Tax=Senna tora TaxID=362788 RepID=A0A834T1B3_9FABA|nr:Kunitz trypsin inhibitor [Senna tora]